MKAVPDFTIAGTGPSALFVTLGLLKANKNLSIRILEAGNEANLGRDSVIKHEITGQDFNLDPTFHIGFGGTSNLWHNVLAPLDGIDFKERDWIPGSGWPYRIDTLDPWYREVAKILNIDYGLFDEGALPQEIRELKNEFLLPREKFKNKFFLQPKKILNTRNIFNQLRKSHKVRIHFNAVVQELIVSKTTDGERVDEVAYADTKKNILETAEVKNLILCTGAFSNVRILLNSNVDSRIKGSAGKNLIDHPMGHFYQCEYDSVRTNRLYSVHHYSRKVKIKTAITLSETLQKEMKLPNSAFYLRPSFRRGIDNRTEKMKLNLLTISQKFRKLSIPWAETKYLLTDLNLARQILQYKFGVYAGHTLVDLMFVTEQIPNQDSRVYLSGDEDKWGYKNVKIDWRLTPRDRQAVKKIFSLFLDEAAGPNKMSNVSAVDDLKYFESVSSAAHHSGTCRMSHSPEYGVVDKDQKVFALENLYISDGSVLPTIGNANTTFTLMALGMRLGQALGER